MIYSPAWHRARLERGDQLRYLYFWGHRTRADGTLTASCMSQWYPRGFTYEGLRYPTAEHWMMAGKARLFGDGEALDKMLAVDDPKEIKALGRQVRNFEPDTWRTHMADIVAEGNFHKFSQHGDLRKWLLGTGDKVLVEASPYDAVWGIGLSQEEAERRGPEDWSGENWLGWCLMDARQRIRETPT